MDNNKRELNPEELEQVNGGYWGQLPQSDGIKTAFFNQQDTGIFGTQEMLCGQDGAPTTLEHASDKLNPNGFKSSAKVVLAAKKRVL